MNLLFRRPRTNRSSVSHHVRFLTKVASAAAGLVLMMGVTTGPVHAYPTNSLISGKFQSTLVWVVSSQRWFEDGTLHRATLRQWLRASRRNQIATAADWSVGILGEPAIHQLGMDGWRAYASSLVICINRAAAAPMMDRSVAELAAACSVLLEQ